MQSSRAGPATKKSGDPQTDVIVCSLISGEANVLEEHTRVLSIVRGISFGGVDLYSAAIIHILCLLPGFGPFHQHPNRRRFHPLLRPPLEFYLDSNATYQDE